MKDVDLRGRDAVPEAATINATVALIQALIPIGLEAVAKELEAGMLRA